jgi:hypothetical protein
MNAIETEKKKVVTTTEVKPASSIAIAKPITGRVIGISHRIKKKKDQEPRPTLISVSDPRIKGVQLFKLETEQDELDFLNGICAIKWKAIASPKEDVSGAPEHQVIFRAAKEEDALVERHESQCHYEVKKGKKGAPNTKTLVEVATDIPCDWIGIQRGDTVAMILGGSGDYFACALSRKLQEMEGMVLRISPFKLKGHRGEISKDDDSALLARLAVEHRSDFYEAVIRDRSIIRLRNAYIQRMDVMKARIACEQRLSQRTIGEIFCTEAGRYPEGSLTKEAEKRKANDAVLLALQAEEKASLKNLEQAVEALDIYQKVFANIKGCGPRITAGLMNAIVDIRRFETPAKLVAYLGVHVMKGGIFARRRSGQLSNWNPNGRQELWNLGDQFNRQANADTKWGNYLKERKAALRLKHPVEEKTPEGKRRYTNGHIQKMALWRTLTRFTEYLHGELWKLEKSAAEAGS